MAANIGTTMSHEMGHNFGLQHDKEVPGCTCSNPTGTCIMYPSSRSVRHMKHVALLNLSQKYAMWYMQCAKVAQLAYVLVWTKQDLMLFGRCEFDYYERQFMVTFNY